MVNPGGDQQRLVMLPAALEGDNLSGQPRTDDGLCPDPEQMPTAHPSVGRSFRGRVDLFAQVAV